MRKQAVDRDYILYNPVFKVLLTVSTPLMLNNLIRTFYTVIDGLFVAQLSPEDFAATAFTWPLNFLFISVGMGIGVGATALIAKFLGANTLDKAQLYIRNTILIAVLIGIGLAIFGYFLSDTFLRWMGGQGTFLEKANIYLKISFIGLIFDFAYFAYQSVLNAQGNTRTITYISGISMILNIILDPFFIFEKLPFIHIKGLGWGVAGAAWATVISKIVLLLLSFYIVQIKGSLTITWPSWKLNLGVCNHILKLAIPSALGYSGAALGFTVMNAMIQGYGTNTLAAFSMVNRISDVLMQPQLGVGMALTSLIGQNIGNQNYERAMAFFKKAIYLILLMSTLASIIIFAFRPQILGIFIKDMSNTDLWNQAQEYLNYTVFIVFFMGMFSVWNGFFQGFGQTQYSMFMSMGRLWLLRIPIILVLNRFTSIGSTGIWIAMLISNMLIVLIGYIIYLRIDWRQFIYSERK